MVWPAVRDNIVSAEDILYWQRVCQDDSLITPPLPLDTLPEHFLTIAAGTLISSGALTSENTTPLSWRWSKDAWHTWIQDLSQQWPSIKKGIICKALRIALTGRAGGPKMDAFLPLIAPHMALLRMKNRE